MGCHVIKLREPATLANGATFNSPGVPCRGAQSVTFICRATDANQLASISMERSNEAADGWQTNLPAVIAEVGDTISAQTLNNSTSGAAAGRSRTMYMVGSNGGIPFRQVRLNATNGGTSIAGFEVWAIVVDNAGDSAPQLRN